MGKVILCVGKTAKNPLVFPSTGIRIYTIEELCYYMYHQLETLSVDLTTPLLLPFLREELGLYERAAQLEKLLATGAGIKDICVFLFCSSNFYDEHEIRTFLNEYDRLNEMTPLQRKKRNADLLFEKGRYREARGAYRAILTSREPLMMTNEEAGDIYHNLAVLSAKAGAFQTAANQFHIAFEKNGKQESFRQYLFALKLSGQEAEYDKELRLVAEEKGFVTKIEENLFFVSTGEDNTYDYHEYMRVKELREAGRIPEYYRAVDELIDRLKSKYRAENG